MAAAGVNGVINDITSLKTANSSSVKQAFGSAIDMGLNAGVITAIQGTPFNSERALAQMLGNGLGVYTGLEINSHCPPQQPENYRKAKQASQGRDARGISQTGRNKGPGLFLHIPEEDEVSQIPDISADDIINGLKRGNAAHSSQQAADEQQPTQTPSITKPEPLHSSTMADRIKDNFKEEITSPATYFAATVERYGEKVVELGLVDKYNRYTTYAINGTERVVENISDTVKANAMYQQYARLATKFGIYAKGAELMEGMSKLVMPAEILQGGANVLQAESGKRMQTAFEETGRIAGGFFGGTLGGGLFLIEEGASLGLLTPVAIATVVASTSAGAALGKEFGNYSYTKIEDITHDIENTYDEVHNKL